MAVALTVWAPAAGAVDGLADPDNWRDYHRTDAGWRYSPLDQIDRTNVARLRAAWVHQPGVVDGGLQATPLAVDGVIYYAGSYNRVFALDAATGAALWHHFPILAPYVDTLIFKPWTRGVAVDDARVYIGTLDGRAIALDRATGAPVWDTRLVDSQACNCNFNSPPVVAGDVVVYGPTGGDIFQRGQVFAVRAATGESAWTFDTLRDDPASWDAESIKTGGGGGWMPGAYDAETDTVYWATGNPAPDFDWGGARPGDNLYTSSIVALDAATGAVKWHHQQIPHDVWDYDSASGEFVFLPGRRIVHLNKSGYAFVYDRANGALANVWPLSPDIDFVETIDPASGDLIGRKEPVLGAETTICPWTAGVRGWNHGAFSPRTGLWVNPVSDICMAMEPVKLDIRRPGRNGFNSKERLVPGPNGINPRLEARDPVTGALAWTRETEYPVLGSLLATGGDLVFVGDIRGQVRALDAATGDDLWAFNTGSGIRGGIISYAVDGTQYILVASGLGGFVWRLGFRSLYPETRHFPQGAALIAFKLGD